MVQVLGASDHGMCFWVDFRLFNDVGIWAFDQLLRDTDDKKAVTCQTSVFFFVDSVVCACVCGVASLYTFQKKKVNLQIVPSEAGHLA